MGQTFHLLYPIRGWFGCICEIILSCIIYVLSGRCLILIFESIWLYASQLPTISSLALYNVIACCIPSNSKRDILLAPYFVKKLLSNATSFALCCHRYRTVQRCSAPLVLHNNSFQISNFSVLIASSFCLTVSSVCLLVRKYMKKLRGRLIMRNSWEIVTNTYYNVNIVD